MRAIKRTVFFLSLILLSRISALGSEISKIDFYGVISPDADKNMIKMTEDLYYTQLKDFNIAINDFREKTKLKNITTENTLAFENASEDGAVFYVIIKRKGDALSKWNCKICLKKASDAEPLTFTKEYDSYYKILMESKTSLNSALKGLLSGKNSGIPEDNSPEPKDNSQTVRTAKANLHGTAQNTTMSVDELAGTWTGEPFAEKIVIMRGGRGFIIYKDGASMNITISSGTDEKSEETIKIKQTGHSNASFFPELKRQDALEAAKQAAPIEWTLRIISSTSMTGEKHTIKSGNNTESFTETTIPVEWTKKI